MITVTDDTEGKSGLRSVKVFESEQEVQSAIQLNDLEKDTFTGEGGRYSNEDQTIILFVNVSEDRGVIEFDHGEEQ